MNEIINFEIRKNRFSITDKTNNTLVFSFTFGDEASIKKFLENLNRDFSRSYYIKDKKLNSLIQTL